MPVVSKRGEVLGDSPIRSLFPMARAAKKQGKKIYHLNIGQPDIATPVEALQAVNQLSDPVVPYGPSEGLPGLRKVVANYYNSFNASVTMEDVIVTTGASEAILFALLSCCDNKDEVIIPEPFYANYLGFAELCNVNIVPITTDLEQQFSLPTVANFEQKITSKTKAIFLCNPGNPTGQLYSEEELKALLRIVKEYNLYLIVDEVYKEFCYDQEFISALSFHDMTEHVIVIDSISKVFSSCGARVGFLITKNTEIKKVVVKYANLRLCPPYYGQHLAMACYLNPLEYIQQAKLKYKSRREILYQGLSEIPGLKIYKPSAAFYNMVELPVPDAEDFCKWLLTDYSHQGATVMLAPGAGFYFNKDIGKSQVRIAYILNEYDLKAALYCLKMGLTEYMHLKEKEESAVEM